MLKQCSVERLRRGLVTRADGRIVLTMRYYPRGLKKELRDEYIADLSPARELLRDFTKIQAASGHEAAFVLSRYEDRFSLNDRALACLERLSRESATRDVYLTCQCGMGLHCHREILMLVARARFGARIGRVFHAYPRALSRLVVNDGAGGDARRGGSGDVQRPDPRRPRSRTAPRRR